MVLEDRPAVPAAEMELYPVDWYLDAARLPLRLGATRYAQSKLARYTARFAATLESLDFGSDQARVYYEIPSSLEGLLLHRLCRLRGWRYVGVQSSRLPGRVSLFLDRFRLFRDPPEGNLPPLDYHGLSPAELTSRFLHKELLPSYMNDPAASATESGVVRYYRARLGNLRSVSFALRRLLSRRGAYDDVAYLGSVLSGVLDKVLRRLRKAQSRVGELRAGTPYIVFPLHVVPETSVQHMAYWNSDLLSTICRISRLLPTHWKLVIKEHPAAQGSRSQRFFRELRRLHNLVAYPSRTSASELLGSALGVVTLSSTIGLEAALAGKPVLLLGDAPYAYHPMCRTVLSPSMDFDLEKFFLQEPPSDLEEQNQRFWELYWSFTCRGEIPGVSRDVDLVMRVDHAIELVSGRA